MSRLMLCYIAICDPSLAIVQQCISRSEGKYIHRIQENDTRRKIWETLLLSPVPAGLPTYVFTAVFRTFIGHDFLQQHLHRIGVKDTPDCSPRLCGEATNFVHLTVCTSLANTSSNFSSDNFSAKNGSYWAARREMAYTRGHQSGGLWTTSRQRGNFTGLQKNM
ncbi:uncharacterized protein TNCV_4300821 [Trichonephila clavipes]|nr:uncharacterized protein TNCV_4300821 [Trichonephila clavipes]